MRLGDGNGLDVISKLKASRPDARGIILTGYGNIATAVTAVKLGAFDYLAKPADADEIYHALMATQIDKPDAQENPMSADRVRWEHIQRVFESCDRNVSETARRLNMHRRTLQRILAETRAPGRRRTSIGQHSSPKASAIAIRRQRAEAYQHANVGLRARVASSGLRARALPHARRRR